MLPENKKMQSHLKNQALKNQTLMIRATRSKSSRPNHTNDQSDSRKPPTPAEPGWFPVRCIASKNTLFERLRKTRLSRAFGTYFEVQNHLKSVQNSKKSLPEHLREGKTRFSQNCNTSHAKTMILEVQRDPKPLKISQNRQKTSPKTLPPKKVFSDHDFFEFLVNLVSKMIPQDPPKVPLKH